ncbi:alpha/beta hydrolase-fold protein [Psychrobium sp. nBUS_13]|uniref:alpha/beta hydrolase-fold protein n=1 Tax=Psychrobium sp. nBUS_13 TaxID=3395319 RepID=UPI003EBC329B
MTKISIKKLFIRTLAGILLALTTLFFIFWWLPALCLPLVSNPSSYQPLPISSLTMQCQIATEREAFSYCISRDLESKSERVIYYFHGRNGNERWWNDDTYYTGEINQHWRKKGADVPTVVSVSLGPLWLLNQDSLRQLNEVLIPNIESTLPFNVAERLAVGESMGGVSVLTLWGQGTPKFDGVAALCPPLPMVSPFDDLKSLISYLGSSTTSIQRGLMMMIMGRALYENDEQWRTLDVIEALKDGKKSITTPLYLSCGKRDDWGCMDGSLSLVVLAKRRNIPLQWEPREGGHCDIDSKSLADFLIAQH